MRGAIPPFPKCVFMARCLVKHRDNFTLPYTLIFLFSLIITFILTRFDIIYMHLYLHYFFSLSWHSEFYFEKNMGGWVHGIYLDFRVVPRRETAQTCTLE
jgi:hypothetical protein